MRVRLTKFSGGHSAARFDDAPCGEALRCKTNAAKRPHIVMLMTDDTGWNDFGTLSVKLWESF